jgi:hypothetical protein
LEIEVLLPEADGLLQVREAVGWSRDMDALEVEPSAQDPMPGDEALADAIRRELREDAATAWLVIAVDVRTVWSPRAGPWADWKTPTPQKRWPLACRAWRRLSTSRSSARRVARSGNAPREREVERRT